MQKILRFLYLCFIPVPRRTRYSMFLGVKKKQDSPVNSSEIIRCPACGYSVSSLSVTCPACGCEIRNYDPENSVQALVNKLEKIDNRKESIIGGLIRSFNGNLSDKVSQKVEAIKNFPIPNNKKDIFDLVHLAVSNINADVYTAKMPSEVRLSNEDFNAQKLLSQTWSDKLESAFQKARSLFGSDSDFEKIQTAYNAKKDEIAACIKAKRNKKKMIIAGIGLAVCAVIAAIYFGLVRPHQNKEKELEIIAQEVREAIEKGDYDAALVKANRLHMDDNYSSDSTKRWNEEREGYLAIIQDHIYGTESAVADEVEKSEDAALPVPANSSANNDVIDAGPTSLEDKDSVLTIFDDIASAAPLQDFKEVLAVVPDKLNPYNNEKVFTYYFLLRDSIKNGSLTAEQAATLAHSLSGRLREARADYITFSRKKGRGHAHKFAVSFSAKIAVWDEYYSVSYGTVSEIKEGESFRIEWGKGTKWTYYYSKNTKGETIIIDEYDNKYQLRQHRTIHKDCRVLIFRPGL